MDPSFPAKSFDDATFAAIVKAAAEGDGRLPAASTVTVYNGVSLLFEGGEDGATVSSTTAASTTAATDVLAGASVVTEELAATEDGEEAGADGDAQGGEDSDPCSNDNSDYDWEEGNKEPCPKGIFDDVKEAEKDGSIDDGSGGGDEEATGPNNGSNGGGEATDPTALPSFYSCAASADDLARQEGTGAAEKLELEFDYEVYTAPGSDLQEVLGTFERRMANGVASRLGLADCPGGAAEVAVEWAKRAVGLPGGGRRSLQKAPVQGRHRMLEGSTVVGLSMDPEDELDAETLLCSSTATTSQPSGSCSPIVGLMTAWVSDAQRRQLRSLASTKEEQEEMLLNEVRSYIEQNSASYLNEDLLHVAYVGDRDLEVGASTGDADKGSVSQELETEGGGNALAISLALLALLVLAVFGAAWVYRRRRSSAQSVDDSGAFPGLTPESDGIRQDFADEDENVPNDNLFGLTDRPSDASFVDASSPVPVRAASSLAALGAASTLAQRLMGSGSEDETPVSPPDELGSPMQSPGPPVNSPETSFQEDASTESSLAPTRLNETSQQVQESSSYDMTSISPANTEDDLSSTFEHLDEYDKENVKPGLLGSPAPLSSPESEPMPSPSEETVVASNRPQPFPDVPVMPDTDASDNDELGIV